MKTEAITTSQPNFNAKVSERFIKSLRGYINNGPNRLKNNYLLDRKLEEYTNFGFNDYTIEMQQKTGAMGFEYKLFAVKDGDTIKNGIVLTKKPFDAYRKIYKRFMEFRKHDFLNIMKNHK